MRTPLNMTQKGAAYYNGGSPTIVDDYHVGEVISGVSRRKPSGWIAPTAYSYRRTSWDRCHGTCDTQVVPGNHSVYSGVVGSSAGRFNALNHYDEVLLESTARALPSTLGLPNRALIAARNNLKSGQGSVGIAWLHRRKTMNLVTNHATRIAQAVIQLRRGNVRAAMTRLGITARHKLPRNHSNVPKTWLELQYGWKPLLSNIHESAKALTGRPQSDWSVTSRGGSRGKEVYTKARYPYGYPYFSGNFDACSLTAEVEYGAFVRIDAIPANTALQSFAGLGLTNPLYVAWDFLPWSFVVDWFLPVGNWLSSLDALLGYASAFTSTSVLTKTNWTDSGVSATQTSGPYAGKSWIRNSYHGRKQLVELVRTVNSGVPMPKWPGVKDPRSLAHMANALSLMAQVFGRK